MTIVQTRKPKGAPASSGGQFTTRSRRIASIDELQTQLRDAQTIHERATLAETMRSIIPDAAHVEALFISETGEAHLLRVIGKDGSRYGMFPSEHIGTLASAVRGLTSLIEDPTTIRTALTATQTQREGRETLLTIPLN